MPKHKALHTADPKEERPASAACLEPGDTAAIFAAMGEAAYVWDAASDRLVWSPNAAKVIGVETQAGATKGPVFPMSCATR